jgi:hypothetical protein
VPKTRSAAGWLLDRQLAAPTEAGCLRIFADKKPISPGLYLAAAIYRPLAVGAPPLSARVQTTPDIRARDFGNRHPSRNIPYRP